MKKKVLALVGALVLTFGMSMTAFAAESPSTATVSAPAGTDVAAETSVGTAGSGQVITGATLNSFATTATVSSPVDGTKINAATGAQATKLIAAANTEVASATILSIVDIEVPGNIPTIITLSGLNVVAGQNVDVIHLKADGTTEKCAISSVGNGTVSFVMNSYSPVAIVTGAASPRTGAVSIYVIALIAMAGVAGAFVCARKFSK